MIYELVVVEVQPGGVAEAVKRIGAASPERDGSATLLGFWTTEIGRVNELVSLWRREEGAAGLRDGLAASAWLSAVDDLVVDTRTDQFKLFPFLPDIKPGSYGGVYELRDYLLKPGKVQDTFDRWQGSLDRRLALSPLLGAFYGVGGSLQRFFHIWPYESANHRYETRARAMSEKVWPPPGGAPQLKWQENSLLIPTAFSPLR